MFKIDMETIEKKIYDPVIKSDTFKEAQKEYTDILNTLEQDKKLEIDSAVSHMETVTIHLTYTKAFRDGMQFILGTMADKEVIEL